MIKIEIRLLNIKKLLNMIEDAFSKYKEYPFAKEQRLVKEAAVAKNKEADRLEESQKCQINRKNCMLTFISIKQLLVLLKRVL